MLAKFNQLQAFGAGDFEHLNGSLTAHLEETYRLLKQWGNPEATCDAGLFHAAYGTAGFEEAMVSLESRQKIKTILGEEVEELVYLYCACDREFTYQSLINGNTELRDRFTGKVKTLSQQQAKILAELTVANELELILASKAFYNQHGRGLFQLFEGLKPLLSAEAVKSYQNALTEFIN